MVESLHPKGRNKLHSVGVAHAEDIECAYLGRADIGTGVALVILARLMHAAAVDTTHTALLKVWFGKAPVNVTWAVVPVTVALPVPGELPVVWPMPPVMVGEK